MCDIIRGGTQRSTNTLLLYVSRFFFRYLYISIEYFLFRRHALLPQYVFFNPFFVSILLLNTFAISGFDVDKTIEAKKMHLELYWTFTVLTLAPTAFPRLMAFFSLCWPPEDGESTALDPRLGWTAAGERRVEVWPGLKLWGLCCWATEFSNMLWSTGGEETQEGRRGVNTAGCRLVGVEMRDRAEDPSIIHGMLALISGCEKNSVVEGKWKKYSTKVQISSSLGS